MRIISLFMLCLFLSNSFANSGSHSKRDILEDTIVDVSEVYTSGKIEFDLDQRIVLSNGAILELSNFDQTPYTNGWNGQFNLGFMDTVTTVEYEHAPMDTVLYFIKNPDDEIDTIGIYPSHPVGYYDNWSLIPFYNVEGYDKVFYIHREGQSSLRCQFVGTETRTLHWATDSMGNGKFEADLVHEIKDFKFNYVGQSVERVYYLRYFELSDYDSINSVEITEMPIGDFDDWCENKSRAKVVHDSVSGWFICYEFGFGLDWEEGLTRDMIYDSLTYKVEIVNSETGLQIIHTVRTHFEIYFYGDNIVQQHPKVHTLHSMKFSTVPIYDLKGRVVTTLRDVSLRDIKKSTLPAGVYVAKITNMSAPYRFTIP